VACGFVPVRRCRRAYRRVVTRGTSRAPQPPEEPRAVNASNTAGQGSAGRRPVPLVVLCALVLLQAGLLVGLAGAWLLDLVRGEVQLPAATIFLVLFALGVAAVLALSARGLWSGRRWARSPVMTWQVLLVVMAVGWLGADPSPWIVAVLVSALAVAVGLMLPAVVAATVERAPEPPGGPRG
jgi:predicted MFS family arabinose efflux permease